MAMSQRLLEKIRAAILFGDYDLTHHAIDEMAEDGWGFSTLNMLS